MARCRAVVHLFNQATALCDDLILKMHISDEVVCPYKMDAWNILVSLRNGHDLSSLA